MSWAAHDMEPYLFHAKLGGAVIWALSRNDFHAGFDWSFGGPQWAPRVGRRERSGASLPRRLDAVASVEAVAALLTALNVAG